MNAPSSKQDLVFKLAQSAANEIWRVKLHRSYPTPGAMKRAIEAEIRSALEQALGLPSTTDGHEEGIDPLYGMPCKKPKENPYANPRRNT